MIQNSDILKKLRARLEEVDGVDRNMVSWKGRSFEPSEDKMWLKETFMPGDEPLTANDEVSATGIYQIDVYYPINGRIFDAINLADDVKHKFKASTVLDGLVKCERSRVVNSPPEKNAWDRVMVQVDYTVHSTNS